MPGRSVTLTGQYTGSTPASTATATITLPNGSKQTRSVLIGLNRYYSTTIGAVAPGNTKVVFTVAGAISRRVLVHSHAGVAPSVAAPRPWLRRTGTPTRGGYRCEWFGVPDSAYRGVVSVPNERTRATGVPSTTAGRVTSDGKRIFRMTPPLVIWWLWVGLVVFSAADLLIQGHRLVPLGYLFGGLAVTGLVFACTAWPRVTADEAGIRVFNPFRVFTIPWGAVRGIYLADSVEVQCARRPPKNDKTVYSWALSSPRRARARAQLRAWQWDQGKRNRPSGYNQLPQSAQSLVKMTTAEIMAKELAAMSDEARFKSVVEDVDIDVTGIGSDAVPRDTASRDTVRSRDAGAEPDAPDADRVPDLAGPAEVVSSSWAWPPVLAVLVPAVGLVITLLVR